jgi:competence protein ComEC
MSAMEAGSSARVAVAAAAAVHSRPDTAAPVAEVSSHTPSKQAYLTPVWTLEVAPIYLVAIAILSGDALGVCNIAANVWVAVALTIAAAVLFLRRSATWATAVALVAIAAAASGAAHRAVSPRSWAPVLRSFPEGANVTIEGRVYRAPERFSDRAYIFVAVERAGNAGAELRLADGTVRITAVGERAAIRNGDEVRFMGALRFPRNFGDPGEFDYAGYLARQGIAATMVLHGSAPLQVIAHRPRFPAEEIAMARERIGVLIDANLAGDARAEMRALVVGDRSQIGEALRQRFALTGLAHMLVISGLHLGFVAAAAFGMVRLVMIFLPGLAARGWANKAAAIAAALAVTAYASVAGGHVSTLRALVMVLAYTFAVLLDRSREIIVSLALAAIVICLAAPGSTADIGFQLSFVSVLAIVLGMRRFGAWWRRQMSGPRDGEDVAARARRIGAVVAGYVAVSFWALLGVAPLTAYHFKGA